MERVRRFALLYPQLGRGEIESIALAVSEKLVVLTNDKQATIKAKDRILRE